jgi:hypothetical protein
MFYLLPTRDPFLAPKLIFLSEKEKKMEMEKEMEGEKKTQMRLLRYWTDKRRPLSQ